MSLVLVGLNHRTAPVELRERLSLSGCALNMALDELIGFQVEGVAASVHEAVILSTCNRLEVYTATDRANDGALLIEQFLAGLQNLNPDELRPYLYIKDGDDAVDHLMRVACGLDAMILGEPQILGQVTQAFEDAHKAGATGPILSHLFSQATHAGKRARTETEISRHTTSVSHAGALLVIDKLGAINDKNVLVVGAGEMAVLAAQALQRYGNPRLTFINRTYGRAEALAQQVGGQALAWYQLEDALSWADAVITATGAPHTVIYANEVASILEKRTQMPLVFVDIAVPRDVEESVGDLPGVICCDIDDLQSTVDANAAQRRAAVPAVEAIIADERGRFMEWYHSRHVTPVIKTLREWAQSMAAAEVEQALNRLPHDPQTERVVQQLAHRIVNRLLHEPTVRLRSHAAGGNGHGYAHAVRELFGLDEAQQAACCTLPPCEHATEGERCDLHCILPMEISR